MGHNNEKGSGFTELLIAITIFNVILLSIVPTFIYSTKATLRNNLRTNSYNLGIRQLERIKSLDYDDVGLTSGNPAGRLAYKSTESRNGLDYDIKTRINWIDDESDGLYPYDSDPKDYKRVRVIVSPPSVSDLPNQSFSTDISRQSQEQISLGGNIEVSALDTKGNPLEDTLFKITEGPSAPVESHADNNGKTTFVMLSESATEGDYAISAEKNGFVVDPTMRNQNTTVKKGEVRILRFILSEPGKIRISLVDEKNNKEIGSTSKLVLNYPSAPDSEYNSQNGSFFVESLFPGVYEIRAENDDYELTNEKDVKIEAGKTTTLTLKMKKKSKGNIHLIVTDSETNEAVPYANVYIRSLSDDSIVIQDITNVQGILEKQLNQQNFKLQVYKSGYYNYTSNFSITHTGNTFVRVSLRKYTKPQGGTVTVTVLRRRDNQPYEDVLILGMGPSFNRRAQTDSNGQVVFSNLSSGWYSFYSWRWGWRLVGYAYITQSSVKSFIVKY